MVTTLERGSTHPEQAARRRRAPALLAALAVAAIVAAVALVVTAGGGSTDAVRATSERVDALYGAWEAEDADAILGFLADDFRAYDADANPERGYSKDALTAKLRDPAWWAAWDVEVGSHFVSPDGRFAAVLSTFSLRSGEPRPAASLVAFDGDQLVWGFDYYGGASESGDTETLAIAPSGAEPGADGAAAVVSAATETLDAWVAAFNGRQADAHLAAYADDARYVDLVAPAWRTLTRAQLEDEVRARFDDDAFRSTLEPSVGSPIERAFFVSADGRYAAAQGTFFEAGMARGHPMVVLVRLEGGRIVAQYNFIGVERVAAAG